MKRLLLTLLVSSGLYGASVDDLTFTLNEAGTAYSVTDCDTTASGSLEIPSTYNGLSVTSIGESAFYNCSSLTSITIPDSVTSIGIGAFYYCTSLTSITIPDSVTSIGYNAFRSCTSLTSITIPGSVTSIGGNAFSNCTSLSSITIPDSVTSIGSSAFNGCYSLSSIIIPDSVTSIKGGTFSGCSSLTSITIPGSVTSIGGNAFSYCTSLNGIAIPESVTSIGESAFSGCSNLVYITIGDSVTSIGDSAFEGTNISYNYTADSMYYLISRSGQNAYLIDGANASGSVNIPTQVNTAYVKLISGGAFSGSTSLTSINIPDSVTSIGESAFDDCESLRSVTIPDSVTSIGASAFNYCTSLEIVNIPNSVTFIGSQAFYNCASLNSITIPDGVTSIGQSAFSHCTSLTSITIPDSVTSIGDYAFQTCTSLTSVTIPDGVTSIGAYAFSHCTSLTSITIPGSMVSIGEGAFGNFDYDSAPLDQVTLPYKFAGSAGLFGIRPEATITADFSDVSTGLLADTGFISGISEEVTFDSSAIEQAIIDEAASRAEADASIVADSTAADANLQQQINDLQAYIDTAVAQARSEGVTAGIQAVTSDPHSYELYNESSIMEMNISNPTLSMLNESEQAQVEFTLETSTDLEDWNIEERIQRTVQATGDKFFVRIKSGTPYVTPTVVTFNHLTYGEILTDQDGNVLYGFSIDSVGGDPLYSGSAWPLASHSTDPEPDADVTAELARGAYSNTSGGPWLKINNRPVYTYAGDSEPNQASGHGLGSVWFTIKPDGTLNQ